MAKKISTDADTAPRTANPRTPTGGAVIPNPYTPC